MPAGITRTGTREAAAFLGLPLRLRRPRQSVDQFRVRELSPRDVSVTRLAAAWLLGYPDEQLVDRLDAMTAAVAELADPAREPLSQFLDHLAGTPLGTVQQHFVEIFDMKRRACPYLSYWTHGDTRNRGMALLRFQHAYAEHGYHLGSDELPDHLAVVLEFAAVGDRLTGDALLAENAAAIGLLREALHDLRSAYRHILDAVVTTLPEPTPQLGARIAEMAAAGPPVEMVGVEPFPIAPSPSGARR